RLKDHRPSARKESRDMAKTDFELDTTIRKVFGDDRRLLFARPRTLRDRLLEWTLPILWLLVAVVVVAALW
ncbi:MAG TPA: hypothetical protein VFZ81_15605, partial [Burkholderiales bacterium]